MKYLSLSLSDIIKFWYGRPRLIELIFKRGNSLRSSGRVFHSLIDDGKKEEKY